MLLLFLLLRLVAWYSFLEESSHARFVLGRVWSELGDVRNMLAALPGNSQTEALRHIEDGTKSIYEIGTLLEAAVRDAKRFHESLILHLEEMKGDLWDLKSTIDEMSKELDEISRTVEGEIERRTGGDIER